ncbi:DHHC palmitoyltransferase-domain-containing protein [Pavlovales sp. CCMP2436]|nr:DHHC palmitoyltransferase-domain-containing protein [Pavlovales sp. CCMP2436]
MAPGARAEKRWAAATWSDGGRAGSGRGAAAPAGREEDPPGLRAARRRPAGNLVGLFFGRVVVGPDANLTLSTAALLTAGAAAFIYAVGSRVHPLVTATETALYLLSLGALLLCATTDPGVFPRNAHCDEAEASSCAAEMRYATVGTLQVPLKWCYACRIFRPPRAAHCQDCGVCVREWDHHCPWMGQCIGKRNYRFFYAFLLLTTVLCAHTAGWAGHHLYHISIQPISRPR